MIYSYYLCEDYCKHCKKGTVAYFLGIDKPNWYFKLNEFWYNGELINTINGLKTFINKHKLTIIKTSDTKKNTLVKFDDFVNVITNRKWNGKPDLYTKHPPYGYKDWESFHVMYNSETGDNNLLRSKRRMEFDDCLVDIVQLGNDNKGENKKC